MFIDRRCPECSAQLRIPATDQRKRIRCPKCGHVLGPSAAAGQAPASFPSAGPDLLDPAASIPQGPTLAGAEQPSAPAAESRSAQRAAPPRQEQGPRPGQDKEVGGEIPQSLQGYQVLRELGRGGMGRVFLARQKSLDRLVALKVMSPRRAQDPTFVARFTREAYAAAQLVHHHIVQIYDIGTDHGCQFFTMEYVPGETLTELVRREGRLDPDVAVGYILQAARGLKFGHDLGMVHRDIKPDNLLLNDQGIVKVADLGLVKLPYAEDPPAGNEAEADLHQKLSMVTRVGASVGTPFYMAPEQARDATVVDARADIYSLGCTLYALLTGKPPFEGKTTAEVFRKHAMAPLVPPDELVKRVPKALSAILGKMLAKKPEDRFAHMEDVIAALEKYLGVQQAGTFSPREEHAEVLDRCVKQFNEAPQARLRHWVLTAFAGGCTALLLAFLLLGWLWPAGAMLGLALLTPPSYFLVRGWSERTYLYRKVRAWALDVSILEWSYAAGGAASALLVLYLLQLFWLWALVGVLALALAMAFYALVDRRLLAERRPAVERAEKLLRSMRLHGLEERALWHFICKYSGRDWEEFFESLFGYEAKLKARAWLRGEAAQRRRKYAAWRDPIIVWIAAHQKARKEARERKHLQAIESKALQAQGMQEAQANQQAAQVADVMVAQAAQVAEVMDDPAADIATVVVPAAELEAPAPGERAQVPATPQATFRNLMDTAHNPQTSATIVLPKRPSWFSLGRLAAALAGAKFRFLAGVLLFTACVLWMNQNQLLEGERLVQVLASPFQDGNTQSWDRLGAPLPIPLAPAVVRDLFNSFYPGIAGLILMFSAFFGRWKPGLVAWPAALVTLLGCVLIPAVGPLSGGFLGLLGGLALAGVSLLIRRRLRRVAPAAN